MCFVEKFSDIGIHTLENICNKKGSVMWINKKTEQKAP